jgi:hypothetical protein
VTYANEVGDHVDHNVQGEPFDRHLLARRSRLAALRVVPGARCPVLVVGARRAGGYRGCSASSRALEGGPDLGPERVEDVQRTMVIASAT